MVSAALWRTSLEWFDLPRSSIGEWTLQVAFGQDHAIPYPTNQ